MSVIERPGLAPRELAPRYYRKGERRRGAIVERVRSTGFVSVTTLASDLQVSDMTIRRDIRVLSEVGVVRVVHGGVSLPHATLRTSEFVTRAKANAEAKRRIAEHAATLVAETDVIAIDAGTTAYDIATQLQAEFAGTVVTNSIPVIQYMLEQPRTRLIGLGGELNGPSQAFAGSATAEQARQQRVAVYFLGAAAVSRHGVYVEADVERATKLAVIGGAARVVLVVDSSKFTASAHVRLGALNLLTTVVTDALPPAAIRRQLRNDAVEVIVVPLA